MSQRVRALEIAVGRPVLQRTRPVELTEAGQAVVRFARQLDMLSTDLAEELQPGVPQAGTRLALVINSDSLHTWVLPALAGVAGSIQLEVLREDQDYSLELLRSGAAAAAITATAAPAPGCRSRSLGTMRYLAVCAPSFAATWFGAGVSAESLARAPAMTFDHKDELQDRFLRLLGHQELQPPRHYVPAAHEFSEAIRLGMGWGMVPEIEIADEPELQRLQELVPGFFVDVPLYWQQWRYGSAALNDVAAAVSHAAAGALLP